jgi:thiol-disulfide isomerase/thioredoxin
VRKVEVLASSLIRCAAALAVLSFTTGGCGGEATPAGKSAPPSVEVVDFQGLEAALAQRRGRGVLLNHWAIWCEPCVAELSELVEVAHEFKEQGGEVLLLSYDLMLPDKTADLVREQVAKFAAKRGIDVPILIYDEPDVDRLNQRFELPGGIPVTLALDREGKLVDRVDEQADKARFTEMMRKALAR